MGFRWTAIHAHTYLNYVQKQNQKQSQFTHSIIESREEQDEDEQVTYCGAEWISIVGLQEILTSHVNKRINRGSV